MVPARRKETRDMRFEKEHQALQEVHNAVVEAVQKSGRQAPPCARLALDHLTIADMCMAQLDMMLDFADKQGEEALEAASGK